jgi:hypothetical protein
MPNQTLYIIQPKCSWPPRNVTGSSDGMPIDVGKKKWFLIIDMVAHVECILLYADCIYVQLLLKDFNPVIYHLCEIYEQTWSVFRVCHCGATIHR